MARVIDFKRGNEERFRAWAREWLIIPDDGKIEIEYIIAFLVANRVFTYDEIRGELRERRISISEQYFANAEEINKFFDLRQK